MTLHRFSVRTLAALTAILALGAATRAQVPATGIFVEAENFVPPNANATLGSGPNAARVVVVDSDATRSGGKSIGFFVSWDWLEYEVNIPEDGLYNVQYRYASGWPNNDTFGSALSFYTSGQQITPPEPPTTLVDGNPNWAAYTMHTVPTAVPLKAGVNRFRLQNRPDYATTGSGGGMNMDYIKFVKAGPYPNLVAVTGTVTTMVNGVATPVQGALVSEDPNPAKGALFTEASHLTRTGADGRYTLYLSPGSHQVTAFANGHAALTAAVAAPGTHDFALTWNGRFEAELLDATNAGFGDRDGVQPAYATGIVDPDTQAHLGDYSADGLVINIGSVNGKYAAYNHVIAPQAGVYDLTMHYSSDAAADVSAMYQWDINGPGGPLASWPGTGSFNTFQDSPAAMVTLKAGLNTVRWTDKDPSLFANMDYFTLTPSTRPRGTLNVSVKDTGGKPVPGAAITVTGAASYVANTDGAGLLSLAVPAGDYNVTATKSAATSSTDVTVAANGSATAAITLAITAQLVEAEDFIASGPSVPGPSVTVTEMPGASGDAVVEGLSGQGDTDVLPSNYRYAEWTVDAPSDGMYHFAMHYATLFNPGEVIVTFPSTSYRLHYLALPYSGGPSQYVDWTPFEMIPLKKGPNTFRVAAGAGGINVDYFTFDLDTSTPATTFATITGVVTGSDGTGSAPIRNALVFSDASDVAFATYSTTTDASGHYTLNVPDYGLNFNGTSNIGVIAAGYARRTENSVPGGATRDIALNVNNPDAGAPPAMRIAFPDFVETSRAVVGIGAGRLSTGVQEIAFVQPGPDTWVDLNVNAPRSGIYEVGIRYGSAWPPLDQPGHLTFSVGDTSKTAAFPKTETYGNYQPLPALVTLPLQAGPNTVRVAFPDAAANITWLDFTRAADLPPLASTDVDDNGVTDLRDAVLYARRLAGKDAGPAPDLTGDAVSDAADVRRILGVAGGLQ